MTVHTGLSFLTGYEDEEDMKVDIVNKNSIWDCFYSSSLADSQDTLHALDMFIKRSPGFACIIYFIFFCLR